MAVEYHTIPGWDKPRGGMFNIIQDSWWCVDDGGNPLFYSKHNHPQCNDVQEIADRIAKARGCKVKQLPFVYVPLRIQDYQ